MLTQLQTKELSLGMQTQPPWADLGVARWLRGGRIPNIDEESSCDRKDDNDPQEGGARQRCTQSDFRGISVRCWSTFRSISISCTTEKALGSKECKRRANTILSAVFPTKTEILLFWVFMFKTTVYKVGFSFASLLSHLSWAKNILIFVGKNKNVMEEKPTLCPLESLSPIFMNAACTVFLWSHTFVPNKGNTTCTRKIIVRNNEHCYMPEIKNESN